MYVPLTDEDFPRLTKDEILSIEKNGKFYPVPFIGWMNTIPNGTCMIQNAEGKNGFYDSAKLWKFGLEIEDMHEISGYDA